MAGVTSFGTLLKAGNAASPEGFTTIANLGDIDGPELATNMEDVTSHDSTSGYDEVMPDGVLGVGEISFELNYDPANATHKNSAGGVIYAWANKTKRNYQLVYSGGTWAFSGYVTKFTPKAAVRGVLKADVSIKPTGTPTLV